MNFSKTKTSLLLALAFILVNVVFIANADAAFNYQLLESFPGFYGKGSSPDLPSIILAIYKFGIWTIGIAGFFMLVVGGIMYAGSAGNNATVTSAKSIISDSILGIVAALGAYLFMYVINPDLTSIDLSSLTAVEVTERAEKSAEAMGTLQPGTAGSCGGLSAQAGISSQCAGTSAELSGLISCIASKHPGAIINSITDSRGYYNCTSNSWTTACAHTRNSCHYGGPNCYSGGKSYAVDLSTRNLSASQLVSAAKECGASYVEDESATANHIHASVGKAAGCGCN